MARGSLTCGDDNKLKTNEPNVVFRSRGLSKNECTTRNFQRSRVRKNARDIAINRLNMPQRMQSEEHIICKHE